MVTTLCPYQASPTIYQMHFSWLSSSKSAYKCYDPITNRLYHSRHVEFVEHIFPYSDTTTDPICLPTTDDFLPTFTPSGTISASPTLPSRTIHTPSITIPTSHLNSPNNSDTSSLSPINSEPTFTSSPTSPQPPPSPSPASPQIPPSPPPDPISSSHPFKILQCQSHKFHHTTPYSTYS